jgi:hypothetical protein
MRAIAAEQKDPCPKKGPKASTVKTWRGLVQPLIARQGPLILTHPNSVDLLIVAPPLPASTFGAAMDWRSMTTYRVFLGLQGFG